jgi:glucans biosynthesis protein
MAMLVPTELRAATPAHTGQSSDRISRHVRNLARKLSRTRYRPPTPVEGPLAGIGYDQYRDIRFKPDHALWRRDDLGFQVQFFPTAYIYKEPVDVYMVEDGTITPVRPAREMFDWGPFHDSVGPSDPVSFSGLRIHAPINAPTEFDELIAFQGASYFRGLGRGHGYGLSARGLALDTTGPRPEEFPRFRAFWLERPDAPEAMIVHALLDSPSITGAYRFRILPGDATILETETTLFPRVDLDNVGVAPLTSMFWFDTTNRDVAHEFRDAVHDSDGLAVFNGAGEKLWRPLLNPSRIQVSDFLDTGPRGFGLIQRARRFEDYQDLEANYHKRPSAWVDPLANWGRGSIELIEIPTHSEYFDNIVAYWRPHDPWKKGETYSFAYRLLWCNRVPEVLPRFTVSATRIGNAAQPGRIQFVVDFHDDEMDANEKRVVAADTSVTTSDAPPLDVPPTVSLGTTAGTASKPIVQPNPFAKGMRVSFELDPGNEKVIELRLLLQENGRPASEVWTYRWLRRHT